MSSDNNSARERLLNSFSCTPQTLRLVWRASRAGVVGIVILAAVSAILPIQIAYVGKLIVDAVVASQSGSGGLYPILKLIAMEFSLVVMTMASERISSLVQQHVNGRLSIEVHSAIIQKALTLELRHFEDPAIYDKLTRARSEASSRPMSHFMQHVQFLRNTLLILGYMGLFSRLSPLMVLVLLVSGVPAFVAETRFSGAVFRMRSQRSPERRRLGYLELLPTDDRHFKEVRMLRLGTTLHERYRKIAQAFHDTEFALSKRRSISIFALSSASTLAFYFSYVTVVVAAVGRRISLGDMTMYIVAFRQAQQSFQAILSGINGMYSDSLYMATLFEFLNMPLDSFPKEPSAVVARESGIRFEAVGFRYPGSEKWAVKDVSFFVPQGSSLAIVGSNGAGKTTVIKLLARLYRPTAGRILLDGQRLDEWDDTLVRKRMAVLFQDFNKFQFRVKDNVGFGHIERLEETDRVMRSLELAGARGLVEHLDKGLESQLGRWFEGGVELSGGEWQKVALARAFMNPDADILILDEPTSALDPQAEQGIFETIRSLKRTTIVISHRVSTVRLADRLIVLEGGRIVEEGDHDQLLSLGGSYSRFFELQARSFR